LNEWSEEEEYQPSFFGMGPGTPTDGLSPFFSYFGSKYRMAKAYPLPEFDTIIEPFAGSAGYSLLHHRRHKVRLYDSYEPVAALWDYLIGVTEDEIRHLPLGPWTKDRPVDDENIAPEAKTLLGFWLTTSQTYASKWPQSKVHDKGRGGWSEGRRELIAGQLGAIRKWSITCCSYEDIEWSSKATWHVDPPYEDGGKRYKKNNVDYRALAEWCRHLPGQVMVCEQAPAEWLPFEDLAHTNNASNEMYKELIWKVSS